MDELKCHKDKEYDAIQIDTDDSYFYDLELMDTKPNLDAEWLQFTL
nr:hypothetical protein [Mycoplasmopsis bovis]